MESQLRERGEREGRKDLGLPEELKQEPGMGVPGEGLLQAQGGGRGKKPGLSQMHFFRSEGSRARMTWRHGSSLTCPAA